jgi:hypothetical protein
MLELKWQDLSGLHRLSNAMGRLDSHQKHLVLQRAVNHTGDKARTQVVRTLAKQTGLPVGVIKKALRVGRAYGASADPEQFVKAQASNRPGSLVYVVSSKGGDISLKYFKARETMSGVTAAPFGKRKLFAGTFLRGGKFPERNSSFGVPTKKAASLNGHVWKRAGKKRNPIELQDSGVIIPEQMLKGASAEAFKSTVNQHLPGRVMHELNRLCPGIFL